MRLIDADALLEKMKGTDRYFMIKFDIEEAPTVNPWYYPRKGELPDKDGEYFILREYRGKLFADISNYSVKRGWLGIVTIPYAWQYVILPKKEDMRVKSCPF